MSTEAKGDGKRDAVGAGEQEAAAGVTSAAPGIPVADSVAGQASETDQAAGASGVPGGGEVTAASEDDEAAGHPDGAASDDAGDDAPSDDAGDDAGRDDGDEPGYDDDYGYDYDGDEEVADGLDEADGGAAAEPIEFAEPVEPAALRRPRRWTRVLIAVGFLIIAAGIVGGAIAIVGSVTHGFKKPVKVTYKKSAVFSLKTGDCFDPSGQSYTLVSCDSAHQAEVFATFALPGTRWPGSAAAAAAAGSGCATRLSGYLNPQLAVSLASTYVYPDATAWQAGTRTVICEVRAASGDLTGSVRGAAG